MSGAAAVVQALTKPSQVSTSSWSSFRLIPRVETYPAVVRFSQTTPGKILLLVLFGVGSRYFFHNPLRLTLGLALLSFLPDHRRLVVSLLTVGLALWGQRLDSVAWMIGCFVLGAFLFWCARKWPRSTFGRRPIVFLFIAFTVMIVIGCTIPRTHWISSQIWNCIAFLAGYIWFIGYALMDARGNPTKDLALEIGSFHPFWGSTNTPFPKGAAYLRRIEARNPEELAVTQLKGIKLLVWAILLSLMSYYWNRFWHGYLAIPTLAQAIYLGVVGVSVPISTCWLSLFLSFFESIFFIAVLGHQIIAGCRMAGFNALRNTYRPLSSVTLFEFFNRFYFYFKELLVDFFFYPTFLRYFKGHRRLRVAAATFAAAALGNAFYHFTRDWPLIYRYGLRGALVNFQVYLFYCAALGIALTISQLRNRRRREGFVLGRLLPLCCVVLFYSLLDIFGSTQRNFPLIVHFRFLAHLFHVSF